MVGGASGSGKSAFLKILAGIINPVRGSYFLNSSDASAMSFEQFLPYRKRIGYSFDFGGILANRTLWDNLMLPLLYHGEVPIDDAKKRVGELVDRFGLTSATDRRPASVSGGMRKACVVARAFVMDPEMVILDDPFVALDADVTRSLLMLIRERRAMGRLKHVFFTSRGDATTNEIATCTLTIESDAIQVSAKSAGFGGASGSELSDGPRKVANG